MYSPVLALQVWCRAPRYGIVNKIVSQGKADQSILLKMAGAGVSGPIPGSVPSLGGGGGADLPEGTGSLLSKYLLKSPASSKGRLPRRRTILEIY